MLKVIETLETQHRALERLVAEANASLKSRDQPQTQETISRIHTLLQAHFALEETQFYPKLRELAARDPALAQVANAFSQNMEVIAGGVLGFFKRHTQGPLALERFVPEWRETLQVLGQRMVDEEKTLHPLLKRMLASANPQPIPADP